MWIQPGHADDSITIHLGHGRTRAGRVASGVGFNSFALRTNTAPWFDTGLEAHKLPGEEHARTRAMLTGVGAGLIFGIQDALTRQTLQILQSNGWDNLVTTWAPYALVGAGAIGIWLMQSAFNAGPLQLSLPAISAGEPLVGILLGVIVFGDRIQVSEGMLAVQAAGIAALVVGVIMVGRAPALSQLRSWAPTIPHGIVGRHSAEDEELSANGLSPGTQDPQVIDMRVPNTQHPNPQHPNSQHPNSQSPNDQHAPSPREQPANGETAHESQPDIRGLPQPSRSLSTLPRRHLVCSHHPFHAGERLRPDE